MKFLECRNVPVRFSFCNVAETTKLELMGHLGLVFDSSLTREAIEAER